MSWDIVIYKFSDYPLTPDADTRNLEKLPLGTVSEVRNLISAQLPETEWESYWEGYIRAKDSRLEFFVGSFNSDEEDLIHNLDIVVYGFDDEVFDVLFKLTQPYRWTIQDLSEGRVILPNSL
jgi:hypothetical protein